MFFKGIKILIFILLALAIASVVKQFLPSTTNTKSLDELGDLNYGLEATNTENTPTLNGQLYFDLDTPTEEGKRTTNAYVYYFQADSAWKVSPYDRINYGLLPLSDHTAIVMTVIEDQEGVPHRVPIVLNTQTLEYQVIATIDDYLPYGTVSTPAKGGDWYAVSFRKIPKENGLDLQNWKIALWNPIEDKNITIDNASSPQWLNNGADLLYVTEDGVYRYNFASESSQKIYGAYLDLDAGVEIAVSPNDDYMVMTLPANNALAVLRINDPLNAQVQEIGRIQTKGMQYITPVFSPDGVYYAVVRKNQADPSQEQIEVRPVLSREPVFTTTLEKDVQGDKYLTAWSAYNLDTSKLLEAATAEPQTSNTESITSDVNDITN